VCKHLAVSMPNLPVFAFDNESMLTLSEWEDLLLFYQNNF
jgi:hypothetical protein